MLLGPVHKEEVWTRSSQQEPARSNSHTSMTTSRHKQPFHNRSFCELSSGDDRPRAFLETNAVENPAELFNFGCNCVVLFYDRRARALDNVSPLFIFMLHKPSEIRTEHCTYFRARHFEALSNARARHDPLNVGSHLG